MKYVLRYKIGVNSAVHMGCFFTGDNISIGKNTVINRGCYLDGRFGLEIEDNVSISPECYLLSLDHVMDSMDFDVIGKKVIIQNYVWIGSRAIILPGVNLKKGCVVGTGSVVTKDVEEFNVVVGVPAKFIKMRANNLSYKLNYFPFFNTDVA